MIWLEVLQQGWNWTHSSSRRTRFFIFYCEGIKLHIRLSWKTRNMLPFALTMFPKSEECFFPSRTMLHAIQPGHSRSAWGTTKARSCHGLPYLKTWTPLKTSGNVIRWKTGGHKPSNKAELLEFLHQKWHTVKPTNSNVKDWRRACQDTRKLWKSGLFHHILISELFPS